MLAVTPQGSCIKVIESQFVDYLALYPSSHDTEVRNCRICKEEQ